MHRRKSVNLLLFARESASDITYWNQIMKFSRYDALPIYRVGLNKTKKYVECTLLKKCHEKVSEHNQYNSILYYMIREVR
jgi:ribosomal protein L15E